MSGAEITGLVLALLVMVVGLAGSVLPWLPSTPLVLLAAIGHKLYFHETGAGWVILTVMSALTLLSLVMDHLASAYGAKRFGATGLGIAGAVVGGIVGLFFSLPGILLGPFIGAFVFELLGQRNLKESGLAGVGAMVGLLAGAVGKFACCMAMMGLWTVNVVYRALDHPAPAQAQAWLRHWLG